MNLFAHEILTDYKIDKIDKRILKTLETKLKSWINIPLGRLINLFQHISFGMK